MMYENSKTNSGQRRLRMTKRILKIINELSSTALTVSELATKLNVCKRTIRRDLDVLIAELVVFKTDDGYIRNPLW